MPPSYQIAGRLSAKNLIAALSFSHRARTVELPHPLNNAAETIFLLAPPVTSPAGQQFRVSSRPCEVTVSLNRNRRGGNTLFFHDKRLQYHAKPDRPDPVYAKKLQEVLGGTFGEMTVMMQYLFQGWNCRGPAKYRDLLLDVGTEEIAHVEMLATMIARLLEGSPIDQDAVAKENPMVASVLGGMSPQHAIVWGLGANPNDSQDIPWNARYMIASGNLLADFRSNLAAESQGRLQVARLYEMTSDAGVRDMLSFLLARDHYHQRLWAAAIEELESDGLESTPVPSSFPNHVERGENRNQFWPLSTGEKSTEGRWLDIEVDGKQIDYLKNPEPLGDVAELGMAHPKIYDTTKEKVLVGANGKV